jgi:hypothetical protein
MEFIESHRGQYPSTEGFLYLLKSLFAVGGFPSTLGSNYRIRTGCAPYVEYIIDFILPRATGRFEHCAPLSFRSFQDKNRFVAIALEVVETILVRYHVPCPIVALEPGDSLADYLVRANTLEAAKVLDQSTIARTVVVRPHVDDIRSLMDDFVSSSTVTFTQGLPQETISENQSFSSLTNRQRSPVPLSKSPGFAVLATVLSPSRASLFHAVVSPLIDRKDRNASWPDFPMLSLAFALYVSTPPTFASAKDGAKQLWTHSGRQSLLLSLLPQSYQYEETPSDERSILSALKILCAAVAREDQFLKRIQSSKAEQIAYLPVLRFSGKSRLPISIDLHLSHLSHILATSDIETGVASSIIDLIGIVSANGLNESTIAAMAFSLVRYLERTLPRAQVFELLCSEHPRRVYGAISEAFNVRFFVALTRPLKEPHIGVLRSIFDRLLLDLRSCTYASRMVNAMFGATSANSSPQQSLEALLNIIERIEFVCGEDSAEVASMCYEVLYRLVAGACKRDEHDKEMSFWVAERLRTTDFWKTHVLRLCSTIPFMQQHSTNLARRYNVIHSISWLLKGISCELHILSGLPSAGRAVSASPNCFKRLSLALFTDNGLIAHAIRVLPIERPVLTAGTVQTPSDDKAVVAAKVALAGSPDVVEGYSTVRFEELKVQLNRMVLSFDENGLLAWVEHWNNSVQMDCSSAHLSDAIRIVISTFFACGKDSAFDVPPGVGPGVTILLQMLSCMDMQSNNPSIDDIFFTTACRNLSLAACQVSISDYSKGLCQNDLEFASLIGLFIRLIAASPLQSRTGAEQIRRKDRIAALSGALMSVLREFPDQISMDADRVCLFDAAIVLADLATQDEAPRKRPFSPSSETIVIRNCCGLLFEKMETSLSSDGLSMCRAVLMHAADGKNENTPMQGIFNSISLLDDKISDLVQKLIFVSPQIGSLMLTSGILEALQKAADNYFKEEEKFLTSYAYSQKVDDLSIQPPSFLHGHFDIMNALMTTQLPPKLSGYLVATVVSISCNYKVMFDRLIRHFPIGGDTMYTMLRCLIQANVLLDEAKYTLSDSSDQSVVLGDNSVNLKTLAGSISKLIFHIAENPLPSHLLSAIPSRLNPPLAISGIVTMPEEVAKPWWVAYEAKSSEVSSFCEIAELGMDLFRSGVFLIRQTSVLATLDEFTLSRSLFRCSDAAKVRMQNLRLMEVISCFSACLL